MPYEIGMYLLKISEDLSLILWYPAPPEHLHQLRRGPQGPVSRKGIGAPHT